MSPAKPEISAETIAKWQKVVDLIARLAEVPSSLIMKTDAPLHSVLVSNRDEASPYQSGQSFRLTERLYCHGVLSRDGELVVEDAARDPVWCDNDDMEFGMSFYVGYPLKWPDGEVFGTICVLDRRRNEQALLFREGLKEFCRVIETDLALLLEAALRREAEVALQATLAGLERVVADRTRDLEEANAALRVLIANLEHARRDHEEALRRKIRGLVRPSVAKLRHGIGATEPHRTHIDVIEANLKDLLSRRAAGLAEVFEKLTPAEVEVAQLVLHGYSTKDIARRMSRGTSTIDFHRNNIRRKLNLGRTANLRSYLTSLQ
jgi:c-di-GMP phosphodiesterase